MQVSSQLITIIEFQAFIAKLIVPAFDRVIYCQGNPATCYLWYCGSAYMMAGNAQLRVVVTAIKRLINDTRPALQLGLVPVFCPLDHCQLPVLVPAGQQLVSCRIVLKIVEIFSRFWRLGSFWVNHRKGSIPFLNIRAAAYCTHDWPNPERREADASRSSDTQGQS